MTKYQFIQTEESGISYTYTEFNVADVSYMAIFSEDPDTLIYFAQSDEIAPLIQGKRCFSIKFVVKEYIEYGNDDLYAPPINHQFRKKEIQQLKYHLENLILEHYKLFKADCYLFVAERDSLARMYRKMCRNSILLMLDFVAYIDLGEEQNCFIVQTPYD